MDKAKFLQTIIDKLTEDSNLLLQAAKSAHEAATHSENIPDNKYDTLSLEASYVAQGQANRAQEIKAALVKYKQLVLKDFDDDSAIYLTALVTLEDDEGEQRHVFIGPESGGLKLEFEGKEVTVITAHSPLGQALIGQSVGELVEVRIGSSKKELEIVEVC